MPNIATILKFEISRIARKEVRAATAALKKAAAGYRSEIAALKRRCLQLEKQQRRRPTGTALQAAQKPQLAESSSSKGRYSAKSLASQRRRLGLSANELGRLIGVSTQSIYNWEEGKARPRATHLPAVMALRTLSRKAAVAHLESLAAKS